SGSRRTSPTRWTRRGARRASRTAWSSSGGPSATTSRISARETRPRSSRTRAPRARERGGIGGASAGLQPPPTPHLRGTSQLFQTPENTCEINLFGLAGGANGSLYVLTRRALGPAQNARTTTMKTLRFGIEIETVGLSRTKLAEAIHSVVGGTISNDYRDVRITTASGRTWKV